MASRERANLVEMSDPSSTVVTMERVDRGVLVDCGTCTVRGDACSDCVVTVLLGPPAELTLSPEEQGALGALAGAGLVPPLRLVRSCDTPTSTVPDEFDDIAEEMSAPWRRHA